MKKLFRTVLAVAVAAAAMTSCQKAVMEEEGGINAVVSFQASFPETKTTFGTAEAGKYPVLWQDGDKVAVSVSLTSPLKDLEVTPSTDKKTGTFSKDVTLPGEGPWAFYVMSPSAAMVNANSTYKSLTVDFATDQTPTAVSVDPAAQVLLAMATATTIPTEPVPVTFNHLAAYGKVSLSNLPTSAKVSGLSLAFDQSVTGRWYFYPEEEDVTKRFQENAASKLVNLTTEKTADVFFAVAPNGVAVKSVKVTLKTEDGNYEKEVTVPEKTFKSGVVSAFTVDMTGASKVQDKVFKLVKNVANLAAGDQVIIANKAATSAISTTQQGNNRKGAAITPDASGDIVNPSDAVQILTLGAGATTGTFSFSPEAGKYLYAVKGSNCLRTKNALEADGSFTVAIAEDGEATVTCKFEGEDRILMHNSSSDLFACYKTTTQKPIAIYKMEAAPVKEDVIKWVPSAAGSEVFANGDGDVTVEPTTADWLTWDKATKTVAWTEAAMPRQAKLTFTNGSTYDLTQIDAKVMAGDWTLTSFQRFTGHISSTKKFSATSEGNTGNQKILPSGTYPAQTVKLAVMTDQALTANTASGSIWAVKSHTNNMTIEGLAEEGLLAKAEFKMDETKASLGIFLQQPLVKAEDLSAPVHFTTTGFTDYYPWLMPELATVNTDKSIKAWRLDFGSLGSDSKYWYEGVITVKGEETTISWLANNVDNRPALSTSTSYRVAGLMVDAFSIGSTEIGSNSTSKIGNYTLLRNVSGDAKTVAAASTASAAYFKVYQGDMILTKSAIVPPTPVVPKNTDEVMTMVAKKDLANYEKYPFWYTKNAWYQSTASSNYTKLQTTTSGGNFNKFVATNIVSKGEIPNGSVVVTMGGDFGYRPEGWVDAKTKTSTRPDRLSEQVTEVTDAWWTSGSQTFTMRGFNLDKGTGNLSDTELEGVIESFAVYVPKPTKAKPDPDAVFTKAGYKLDDYTKLELTYNKYAFYNSTDDTKGGVIQNKENVPTATNLGQFVATGIIDKANIPNGSVLVVCDGYQYRPEGWQVKGEKNTASRPGNVTTAVTVVDDAWWGNFNYRAFNLAYAGNPGIPVTEMDHVIASFAIYVPKADPDPTHIDTAEKLVAFLKAATAETTTDYIMTKDVDMKGVTVPTAAGFKGTFDGKGKTIKNLAATAPLFATLDGTVKNVTLEGAFTLEVEGDDAATVGHPFAPLANVSTGTVENVINKASVTMTSSKVVGSPVVAGLVAYQKGGTFKGNKNYGAVSLTHAGTANVTVTGFNRKPFVVTAGVVGVIVSATAEDCVNEGNVSVGCTNVPAVAARHYIGGVVGTPEDAVVKSCTNKGKVTGDFTDATKAAAKQVWVGGVIGGRNGDVKTVDGALVEGCYNYGECTLVAENSVNNYLGGIAGQCTVEALKSGTYDGTQESIQKLSNCSNYGKLVKKGAGGCRLGGIHGGAATLENCINEGEIVVEGISTAGAVGGLVGYPTQTYHPVTGCKNTGSMTATCNVAFVMGGLFGQGGNTTQSYEGCTVNCTMTAPSSVKVGIILGTAHTLASGKTITYGSAEKPFKVKGSVNGTALTAENFTTLLLGNTTTAGGTIDTTNVQFGE